jgi:DNA-directed RNA polymerase subunit K/omega
MNDNIIYLNPSELTLFERTELISVRSIELQKNKEPLVEIADITDPIKIAIMEFSKGVIPYTIVRKLPSGEEVHVKLKKQ